MATLMRKSGYPWAKHTAHDYTSWWPGLVLMAMVVLLLAPFVQAGEQAPPVVTTTQGVVQGSSDGAIAKFLGIPYEIGRAHV